MKIVVTGANGFIGQRLVENLMSSHKILACTRSPVANVIEGVDYINFDLRSIKGNPFKGSDVLIHTAHHDQRLETKKTAVQCAQAGIAMTVGKLAVDAGIKRLIFLSSIKVYGETSDETPFLVEHKAAHTTVYGAQKYAAEVELNKALTGSSTELVIIRPPMVYGEPAKGNYALLKKCVKF